MEENSKKSSNITLDVTIEGLDELESGIKKISALLQEANALIAKVKNTQISARVTPTEH